MPANRTSQSGFTLLEIAIVVLIISILLGYSVAFFPKQQELRKYQDADREMDKIIEAIVGFAQVNGRLPCPSLAASAGVASGGGLTDCLTFGGFVPSNTLGFQGRLNIDSLLADPWGNPYRYYVSNADADGGGDSDFVTNGQMQEIGLVDIVDIPNGDLSSDGYIDLDGQYVICNVQSLADATDDICANPADVVFGNAFATGGPYAGAPIVLISLGKNGGDTPAANTGELENKGSTNLGGYMIKAGGETTFVKKGFADDYDDIVKWVSPSVLFSKMIEAGQLP
ncbi:MAG: type II secretion system protein [Gammaproteobacteria bacterium]|nr:type II secretion system protein [Gammaproteobacteria bacterium]